MTDNNIAIAHKDYATYGGSEVLAEELARTFDAPLYVGHKDETDMPDSPGVDVREIAPDSRWHTLIDRGGALRGLGHMMHWRDNAPSVLSDYDTVITSGNEPLWWTSRDHQTVIAYTHSTPRWMYDLYHDIDGWLGRTFTQLQRQAYEGRRLYPDRYVANSDLVARRIRKYWNIPHSQIQVVYPPVATHEYSPSHRHTGDYYLYLGRLDNHKRVTDLVDVFNRFDDTNLWIAGDGPMRDQLERQAARNVRFEGFVTEDEKRGLYAGAKALVYPAQNEDFGMVPIEAMASGTPVIGVEDGFTQYQIQDGKNGLLFERSTPSLHKAVKRFERDGVAWSEREIADWAGDWFSADRFRTSMQTVVREAEAEVAAAMQPPWRREQSQPPAGSGESADGARVEAVEVEQ